MVEHTVELCGEMAVALLRLRIQTAAGETAQLSQTLFLPLQHVRRRAFQEPAHIAVHIERVQTTCLRRQGGTGGRAFGG